MLPAALVVGRWYWIRTLGPWKLLGMETTPGDRCGSAYRLALAAASVHGAVHRWFAVEDLGPAVTTAAWLTFQAELAARGLAPDEWPPGPAGC